MTIPSSVRHSLARAGRLLVAGTCVAVAAWALITVGLRMFHAYRRQHDGRIHLTVLQWGDATATEGFRRLLARFEDLHPGVNVMVLNTALFDRKLFTMIAGNMSPDVFYVTADNLSIWANSGLLLNLDPWLAKDPGGPGTAPLSDYYPRLLEWFQFDGRQEGKGPRYGLPAYHSPRFMIVNKALFARAGVPVPYDGWNWEEYKETLLRVSALTEPGSTGRVYGGAFSSPTELVSLFAAIANNGGQLFLDKDPLGKHNSALGSPRRRGS